MRSRSALNSPPNARRWPTAVLVVGPAQSTSHQRLRSTPGCRDRQCAHPKDKNRMKNTLLHNTNRPDDNNAIACGTCAHAPRHDGRTELSLASLISQPVQRSPLPSPSPLTVSCPANGGSIARAKRCLGTSVLSRHAQPSTCASYVFTSYSIPNTPNRQRDSSGSALAWQPPGLRARAAPAHPRPRRTLLFGQALPVPVLANVP